MQKGNIGVTTENIFPIIKKFLYSDHEIFLRELVSNAVDATQKLNTLASIGEFKGELGDLTVHVELGKDTITISDRGIGLTAEEIEKYINQIAFSGANDFLEKYKNDANAIIGHFGLGFYSAFMVAKKVEIITKSYRDDAKAVKWTCDGSPEFTIEEIEKAEKAGEYIRERNMAAILAEKLESGKKCPVCGSTEHPEIAKSIEKELMDSCEKELMVLKKKTEEADREINKIKSEISASAKLISVKNADRDLKIKETGGISLKELRDAYDKAVSEYTKEEKLSEERKKASEKERKYAEAEKNERLARATLDKVYEEEKKNDKEIFEIISQIKVSEKEVENIQSIYLKNIEEIKRLTGGMSPHGLLEEAEKVLELAKTYSRRKNLAEDNMKKYNDELSGRYTNESELVELHRILKETELRKDEKSNEAAVREKELEQIKENIATVKELRKTQKEVQKKSDMLTELSKLTEGNRFVEYMAENQLEYIAEDASVRLKNISGGRYALELFDGEFIIRDDFCGGIRRKPSTLSGGETFLTSFSLALALSSRIQMKNSASLNFFFLDEGFGTLDKNTIDVVMKSLERLSGGGMSVGIITHVEEVKERLPVRLVVEAAVPGEHGSRVSIRG